MNFNDFSSQPEYARADDEVRRQLRRRYFDTHIAPTLDDWEREYEFGRFEKMATVNDNHQGVIADHIDALQYGAYSGAASLASGVERLLGGDGDNMLGRFFKRHADKQLQEMNPRSAEAMQGFGFDDNLSLKDSATVKGGSLSFAQGVGSFAPSMLGGGVVGAGVRVAAGQLARFAPKIAGAIHKGSTPAGYGIAGGAMVGSEAAESTKATILASDYETLKDSPQFQAYYREEYEKQDGGDTLPAFERARTRLADEAASGGFWRAAPIGAASMAVAGPKLEKILRGKGAGSRLGNLATGAAVEGAQEFVEGAGGQLASNLATRDAGIEQPVMEGVVGQGVTGAVIGAGVGGTIGSVAGPRKKAQASSPESKESDEIHATDETAGATDDGARVSPDETIDAYTGDETADRQRYIRIVREYKKAGRIGLEKDASQEIRDARYRLRKLIDARRHLEQESMRQAGNHEVMTEPAIVTKALGDLREAIKKKDMEAFAGGMARLETVTAQDRQRLGTVEASTQPEEMKAGDVNGQSIQDDAIPSPEITGMAQDTVTTEENSAKDSGETTGLDDRIAGMMADHIKQRIDKGERITPGALLSMTGKNNLKSLFRNAVKSGRIENTPAMRQQWQALDMPQTRAVIRKKVKRYIQSYQNRQENSRQDPSVTKPDARDSDRAGQKDSRIGERPETPDNREGKAEDSKERQETKEDRKAVEEAPQEESKKETQKKDQKEEQAPGDNNQPPKDGEQPPKTSQQATEEKAATSDRKKKDNSGEKATQSDRIEDFGEKIGGARKDVWRETREALSGDLDKETIAKQSLTQNFPKPDYERLVSDGARKSQVALLAMVRENLPAKPRAAWKVSQWAAQIKNARDLASMILDFDIKAEQGFLNKNGNSIFNAWIANTLPAMEKLPTHLLSKIRGWKIQKGDFSIVNGKKVDDKRTRYFVQRNGEMIRSTLSDDLAAIQKKLPITLEEIFNETTGKKPIRFDVYGRRSESGYFIAKKVTSGKVVSLKEGFESVKEASDYIREHQKQLEKEWKKLREIPDFRYDTNSERKAPDHRKGKDVTPEAFSDALGFRGVEFGNYVEGKRRQQDLNNVWDAFHDMTDVLGIPLKSVSLGGRLGLAFGARGKGGVRAASAHYEPDREVINLTKTSGHGSLAHEWWHALDNYMVEGAPVSKKYQFMTRSYWHPALPARQEMKKAFEHLMLIIKKTGVSERSEKLDRLRSKNYWSTDVEMSARLFEDYIKRKLIAAGFRNDYLANIREVPEEANQKDWPYLLDNEYPAIEDAFDKLFRAMKFKTTDKGIAPYSLREKSDARGMKDGPLRLKLARLEKELGIRVPVLKSETELPSDLYRTVARDGLRGRVRGLFDPQTNQVFLIGDNLDSVDEAVRTVLHETVGHRGIRQVLGNDLEKTMNQIYRDMPDTSRAAIEKRYRDQLKHLTEAERYQIMAEEYVALTAEINPKSSLVQQIVSAIRKVLRKLFPSITWTDKDIASLLKAARRAVRKRLLFSGKKDGPRYAGNENAPTFYSAVERAVASIPMKKGNGNAWLNAIKKQPFVTADELNWLGLDLWLKDNKEVLSREEVREWVDENRLDIKESLRNEKKHRDVLERAKKIWRRKVKNDPALIKKRLAKYLQEMIDDMFAVDVDYYTEEIQKELEEGRKNGTLGEVGPYYGQYKKYTAEELLTEDGDFEILKIEDVAEEYAREVASNYDNDFLYDMLDPDVIQGRADEELYFNKNDPDWLSHVLEDVDLDEITDNITRYESISTKGGKNYNELLLGFFNQAAGYFEELDKKLKRHIQIPYDGPHWDKPNILAHVRFQDFQSDTKENVLLIDEVQSDWHQAGRDKGYVMGRGPSYSMIPNAPMKESWPNLVMKRMIRYAAENGYGRIAWTTGEHQNKRYRRQLQVIRALKVTPEGFHLMDSNIRNIEVSAYQVEITDNNGRKITKRVKSRLLEDYIGSRLADKVRTHYEKINNDFIGGYSKKQLLKEVIESTQKDSDFNEYLEDLWNTNDTLRRHELKFRAEHYFQTHPDLNVPLTFNDLNEAVGSGIPMLEFYDKRLVNFMKKYVKKWGAKVETVNLETENARKGPDTYWSIPVTDTMRESVLQKGQPLFSLKDKKGKSVSIRYALKDNLPDEIRKVIRDIHGRVDRPGWKERVKTWLSGVEAGSKRGWYQGTVDRFHSIAHFEKGNNDGQLERGESSAYKAALRSANVDGVMSAVLARGVPELKDGSMVPRKDSQGFVSIFEEVAEKGELEIFEVWAGSRRAMRLLREGRENLYTPDKIRKIQKYVNGQADMKARFEKTFSDWQQFNGGMLDFAEQAGLINKASRALWEHDDYIPFHRIHAVEEKQSGKKGKRSLSGQNSGIKTLEGGVEKISPLEAMYRNTRALLDAAMKNIAAQRIVTMGQEIEIEPEVFLVEKNGTPLRLGKEEMDKRLSSLGIKPDSLSREQRNQWQHLLLKYEQMETGAVTVSEKGKAMSYVVNDPLLYKSITDLGADSYHWMVRALGWPKRLLTATVTAEPSFMFRNLIRDTLSTWMTVHPEIDGKALKVNPVTAAIRSFKKRMEKDDSYWKLMMAGGGSGGFYDIVPENIHKKLSPTAKEKLIQSPKDLWHAWQKFGSRFENANRLEVFDRAIKQGGSVAEAAHQAQDVLNFSRSGQWNLMRLLTQTLPFFNARVQGLDRLWRGAKADNKPGWAGLTPAFIVRGSTYMMAAMALVMAYQDDERYKSLPQWERQTYHHIFIGEHHFRIPKPFEVGALFGTLPEMITQTLTGREDMKWFREMTSDMLTQTLAFDPVPQAFRPALDVARNKNNFTDMPVVPLALQYTRPETQYDVWTSETIKKLSQSLPEAAPDWARSPKKLESLVHGYFGTLGQYILQGVDVLTRQATDAPTRPEKQMRDMPVVGSFIRDGVGPVRYTGELYEIRKELNSLVSSMRSLEKEGRIRDALKLERSEQRKLNLQKGVESYARQISEYRKSIRQIVNNRIMTAQTKRQRIDAITLRINRLAEQAVKRYGKIFR